MADAGTCAAAQLWGDFASHVLRGRLCGDRLPPARRSRPGGAALPASACGGGEGGPRKTRSVTRGGVLRLRPVLTRPPGGNEHARMRRDRLLAWAQGCIPKPRPGPGCGFRTFRGCCQPRRAAAWRVLPQPSPPRGRLGPRWLGQAAWGR